MPSAAALFHDLVHQLSAAYDEQVSGRKDLEREVRRLGDELSRVRVELADAQAHQESSSSARRKPHQESSPKEEEASTMVPIVPVEEPGKLPATPKSGNQPRQEQHQTRSDLAIGDKATSSRSSPNCIIDPSRSQFIGIWDMVSIPALLWVALITPIQIGVLPEAEFNAFFVLSLCVDLIFVVDLFLQFFIAYPVATKGIGYMEKRQSMIIKHYLKGWFTIEFITVIPFDLISMSFNAEELNRFKAIRVIRTLRLLKLARILKASRIFHRMEITLPLPYQRLALLKFIVLLVLMCHWQASVWAMTLQLSEGEPQWSQAIQTEDGPSVTKQPFTLYVAAFYFCCYTMTSVGYGDIGPKNNLERITCTIMVLVSGLCWAYILGEVSGIVSDLNEESQNFRKKMDKLNEMLEERGVPEGMKKRLRSFFLSSRSRSEHMTQKDLLQNMSPTLQGEVSLILNKQWIAKVSFLKEFLDEMALGADSHTAEAYRACIADVARMMDTVALSQSETFMKVQRLHIIYRGLIATGNGVLKKGDVWGEDFVLSDVSLISAQRCCALTYAEVMFIDREPFMEVVEDHKYECPQLKAKVRRCTVRLAVRRGIKAEAKRQQSALQKTASFRADNVEKELESDTTRSQAWRPSPPDQTTNSTFLLPNSILPE